MTMIADSRNWTLGAVTLASGLLVMFSPDLFALSRDMLGYLLDTYFLVFLDSETARFLCF